MFWIVGALLCLVLGLILFVRELRATPLEPAPLNLFVQKRQLTSGWSQSEEQALSQDLSQLLQLGWSAQVLASHYLPALATLGRQEALTSARYFASPLFCQLWQAELPGLTRLKARRLLGLVVEVLDQPASLSGDWQETYALLGRIWPLSPSSSFWSELAQVVDVAFPGNSLAKPSDRLAKQVHQLRYLLSKQQSLWVREHYGQKGQSGCQALLAFLATCQPSSYQLEESARLHNKQGFDRQSGDLVQPLPITAKVLVGFHSEFIVDQEGHLLNILDTDSLNGLVNGASFNYAQKNGRRHRQLDVRPIRAHDPNYRQRVTRQGAVVFRVPQPMTWRLGPIFLRKDWVWNYHNPKGYHAQAGRSKKALVTVLQRSIRQELVKMRSVKP